MLKRFPSSSFKRKFKIVNAAHTKKGHDPVSDFKAFESNLRAINQTRALGKITELVSDLCPNASDLNQSAYQAKKVLNTNYTAAHHLMASLILTIYHMQG